MIKIIIVIKDHYSLKIYKEQLDIILNLYIMDNFNVSLEIKKNDKQEVEVNGYNRRSIINHNIPGKLTYYIIRPELLRSCL
jgi:hypothetical protein